MNRFVFRVCRFGADHADVDDVMNDELAYLLLYMFVEGTILLPVTLSCCAHQQAYEASLACS